MQKKEMQQKCDYDLIAIYQNEDGQEKKDALEVMYMRYQPLIYKIAGKYCQYTGVSNFEDFQQEAFFELVRVLDQTDLSRVTSSWKIVWVYKHRLKNLMGLMKRHEVIQSNHTSRFYKSDKNRRNVEVKSSPFKPVSSDKGDIYEYQIDYIQNCFSDEEGLESSKRDKQLNQIYYFIENYLKSNGKDENSNFSYDWLREVLKLVIFSGINKGDACRMVGLSTERYYQVVNKNRKYYKHKKSLKEKWEEFQEECEVVLY